VATIGIKIANGEFYSILEENLPVKKRLILTTVHDKQSSVQIDLYKSIRKTMTDAHYIGRLVVENIKPTFKGEPSIELAISSDHAGNLSADVMDMDPLAGKEHQYLNISMETLDEDEYLITEFEPEEDAPPMGLYEQTRPLWKQRSGLLLFVLCTILASVFVCIGLWFFLLRPKNPPVNLAARTSSLDESQILQTWETSSTQSAVVASQPVTSQASVTRSTSAAPPQRVTQNSQAPDLTRQGTRPVPPVASYTVPLQIPREGVIYQVRFGDTLWDIAEAFYRNPWLYTRIARFNNIRNPDRIFYGTTIRIPPRN
jgi:hypothetical protein